MHFINTHGEPVLNRLGHSLLLGASQSEGGMLTTQPISNYKSFFKCFVNQYLTGSLTNELIIFFDKGSFCICIRAMI